MLSKIGLLAVSVAIFVLPLASAQQDKPRQVTAFDALDQIQTLLTMDEIEKRPANDTLWVVKQMVMLNNLQISHYELVTNPPNSGPVGLGLQQTEESFRNLRESLCKQRPNLKFMTLEGRVKTCQ